MTSVPQDSLSEDELEPTLNESQPTEYKRCQLSVNQSSSIGRQSMQCHATSQEISTIPDEIRESVREYVDIFTAKQPTQQQLSRLEQILDDACHNSRLHFWISEAEHILGHQLGYFEKDLNEQYLDQKAKNREQFGGIDTDFYNCAFPENTEVYC